jgi:hypothetical protein
MGEHGTGTRIRRLLRPGLLWAAGLLLGAEILLRLFPAVGVILGSNMDFHRAWYEFEAAAREESIEILILGDSAVQNSVHPGVLARRLGVDPATVYNLSWGGGNPTNFLPFLRGHLPRMGRLRKVVWVMNDYRFTNKGCIYPDHASMDWRTLKAYAADPFQTDLVVVYLSRVYRMYKLWRMDNVRFLFKNRWIDKNDDGLYFPDGGGWMMVFGRSLEKENKMLEDMTFYKDAQPCGQGRQAFLDMARLIRDQGSDLLILRHALWEPAREYFQHECPEIYAASKPVLSAAAAQGMAVLDLDGLQDFLPTLDAYYTDFQHLTYFGAVEYSTFLADHLKRSHAF